MAPQRTNKRGGDDQGQRNFQGELRSRAAGALNVDFAVQGGQVGANYVEANAAAGKFGFDRGGGEARVE